MRTERRSALFLTPECPYPMAGGGALRSASLLNHLARGYDVEVIVFREPRAPDPKALIPPGLIRDLLVIDLPANGRTTAARAIRTAGRLLRRVPPLLDRFAGFGDGVRRFVAGKRYQVGVVEHFWCAHYARELGECCTRLLLDLHNIESVLHARCAACEPHAAAAAHRVFSRASERLERAWLPRFSGVLVTSDADARRVREISPRIPVSVYPNALPAVALPPLVDEEAIVFSGNLEYHPNVGAVRFFRDHIWPRLRERWPSLRWRLVGRNAEAVRRFTGGDPRIEVRGPVEDAIAELARARVAVVPLLAGSGTRFKILEAWAAGVPVVSTTVGAEGLPVQAGENVLLADTPSDFAACVSDLLSSGALRTRIGAGGRALFQREFTWESAWKTLDF